jgi:hypothetical protein
VRRLGVARQRQKREEVQAASVQRTAVAVKTRGIVRSGCKGKEFLNCLPEKQRLEIVLQRADVDVGWGGRRTGSAAPALEFSIARKDVSAERSSAQRSWSGIREER